MPIPKSNINLIKALSFLTCSAFLFSLMGVCIRYASHTVDNPTIVFFRNFVGLYIFLPLISTKGIDFFKTEKIWMHSWRAVIGLMPCMASFMRLPI